MKPKAILKKLKLAMPIDVTVEDPLTKQPIVVAYDNLHSLLVLDLDHLDLEAQVVANLYAEMSRIEHAFRFEAARSEGRYRTWRAKVQDELRAEHKKEGKKAPTKVALEDHYRSHPDYDEMNNAGKRFEALAGFFHDLKWAFKMKSEQMSDQSRSVGGYAATARNEESTSEAHERLADYENLSKEAAAIAAASGSSAGLAELLSGKTPEEPSKSKAPRALD